LIITAVLRDGRRRRYNVIVDGELAVTVHVDLVLEYGIRPGKTTSHEELAQLAQEDEYRTALDIAFRLLSYRPRSEGELRRRLLQKGIGQAAVARALKELRERGHADDEAFARFFVETRQATRPRSAWLLTKELRAGGVAADTARAATEHVSDDDAAMAAAKRRVGRYAGLPYDAFRERLGRFLTSRGFGYEVARRTVDACWASATAVTGQDG
jgi:regulatory protein